MKLIHLGGDEYDWLGGKGYQARVRISDDGTMAEVLGRPRKRMRYVVSALSISNVAWLLKSSSVKWRKETAAEARAAAKAAG